jgi:hypothetical protein
MLQQFLDKFNEPAPEETVPNPEELSVGDRIYYALKAARDPEYAKRVVEPMIAARKTYPQRKQAAAIANRKRRLDELSGGLSTVSLAENRQAMANWAGENAESRRISAEASKTRAGQAVARGGKVRVLIERDSGGNPVNAPYVEDFDEEGNRILRRIDLVGPGAGGEEVSTLGTPRYEAGKVMTDATGKQHLIKPGSGKEVETGIGFKQPPVGVQQSAARAVSTIAGFKAFEKVYTDYQASQLGASPSTGDRLMAQARGKFGETFPAVGEIMDIPTSNFIAARRGALNRYIKDVTGAQFSIKELERYESQLPGPGAPPESALPKIRTLVNQSLDQLRAFIRQNGGLQAMIDNPELQAKLAKETDFASFIPDPANPATKAWYEGGEGAGASAEPAFPQGIPAGSRRVGKSKSTGKPLWRSPDGKLWSE